MINTSYSPPSPNFGMALEFQLPKGSSAEAMEQAAQTIGRIFEYDIFTPDGQALNFMRSDQPVVDFERGVISVASADTAERQNQVAQLLSHTGDNALYSVTYKPDALEQLAAKLGEQASFRARGTGNPTN
jgi:hypothetical protein